MDFAASEPHYLDHLVPLWHALDEGERGVFHVRRHLIPYAVTKGIDGDRLARPMIGGGGPIVVASWKDLNNARHRPAVLLEHGVGQTYGDTNPSSPGGTGRENVRLFLCPNADVAHRNAEAYPDARVAIVGCPKLDPWHPAADAASSWKPSGPQPVVAVSFHWENPQAPESRSAWRLYATWLRDVPERFPGAIATAHPRAIRQLGGPLAAAGFEVVDDFADVLERADLYVCDNSSTMYEFASTGRPVLALNAPWYRRDVSHGLRFWEHVPGLQVDEPTDLVERIEYALTDPPRSQTARQRAVARALTHTDGRATERAVAALRDVALLGETI